MDIAVGNYERLTDIEWLIIRDTLIKNHSIFQFSKISIGFE